MKKILVVATYPIKNPQHGGQKRTDAIVRAYKKKFGSARFAAVFFRDFYKSYSKWDIPLGFESEQLVRSSPFTGDIICGEAISNDTKVKSKFKKLLLEYHPDVVHIEQPFCYLGLKPLLEELGLSPKIIFGSQNIEAPMKREILEGAGVPEKEIAKIENQISELEKELSIASDLLVACTRSDLLAHENMGAKNAVLAPNGVAQPELVSSDVAHWSNLFNKKGISKVALFVGSAHPPNWAGFLDMVGKGLGFVPSDARVVLAGSICDYFDREIDPANLDIEDATFWLRAFSAGRLSEKRLVGLIAASDVIILPITEGGGSNLKTAEAIIANKKVVATSHALRSFEWFKDFPNVWVADTKEAFQQSINTALTTPSAERSHTEHEKAKDVLWESCLEALMGKVEQL